jgi:hypothetical protein
MVFFCHFPLETFDHFLQFGQNPFLHLRDRLILHSTILTLCFQNELGRSVDQKIMKEPNHLTFYPFSGVGYWRA